ncbi:hypothetical protein, conserved in T. vivax [Trypanosoma vivax Y486]|uniref:Leucine-rich repeat protein (LRRP) n=1 Tax=Trypanosoma vivax (strain Y486) TaxID=1055687 RepID=F9WNF9_TRYVY|nr:hypothetical protein, conserved in T. vivax [Trypanosoma vivax Y486]|eukprot:CCD19077.1 hypothetical protein, conserved in T. vivax [Trypanosoma vivax Y486]
MQTLVELKIYSGKVCVNFEELSELPYLPTLSLCTSKYPCGVKSLSKCTTLVKLSLAFCYYPTDLLPLVDMKSLEELHIALFTLPPGGVIGIPPLLRHLEVSGCNVTNESFKVPESNVLECLDISSCDFLTDLSFIRKMERLEKLLLDSDRNIEYGFEALSELPFLRHISAITRDVLPQCIYPTLREKGIIVY